MSVQREKIECPRCARRMLYLVKAYWKPPEHPGFCSLCCAEAVVKFDADQWPPAFASAEDT